MNSVWMFEELYIHRTAHLIIWSISYSVTLKETSLVLRLSITRAGHNPSLNTVVLVYLRFTQIYAVIDVPCMNKSFEFFQDCK